ncbi:MAG: ATP synthase subunit I [Fibrobacteres bacterium]|jgi:F1F0 ATPase subunit 2|nr:ATP synthase subunit I [Fibrobacterota bacterium]
MDPLPHDLWVFAVGAATGIVFYGGLWWTIREVPGKANPGWWFAASTVVRTVVSIAGFWLVMDGNWRTVVLCLVGFLAARLVVTWATASNKAGTSA